MSSDMDSLAVDQAGAATTASTPLPGTFLGLSLGLRVCFPLLYIICLQCYEVCMAL